MNSSGAKPAKPRVTACVATYNSASSIFSCLDSFFRSADIDSDAVVVDNASTDGSAEIASGFDRTTIIRSLINTGFAAAANAAFHASDSPFIFFLNPDVILDSRCVATMAEALYRDDGLAAVQPKLLQGKTDERGRPLLDSTGIHFPDRLNPVDRGFAEPDLGQYAADSEIDGPTAACALWKKSALEELEIEGQVFDEFFFAYYEDVDLALRARRMGYRFKYCARASAVHDRKNPPFHGLEADARAFANRYLLLLKDDEVLSALGTLLRNFPRESARWIYKSLTQRNFFVAWRQMFKGIPHALRQRRLIRKREKSVSTSE